MLSHYDLTPVPGGYEFVNKAGDRYFVYQTEYSLLDARFKSDNFYLTVYMLGFSCKRLSSKERYRYDAITKATIIFVFKKFLKENSESGFIYVCESNDARARNRNITFARWFNEDHSEYERISANVIYEKNTFYSSLIIKKDNIKKKIIINAYHYTLKKMIDDVE